MTKALQASVPNTPTYMHSAAIFIYNVIPLSTAIFIYSVIPLNLGY